MESRVEITEKIKTTMLVILIVASIIEMIVFPCVPNLIGCVVSIISTLLFNKYIFRYDIIYNNIISFFVIFPLFLFMYLPIPVTLFDGVSMSHDLFNPERTFTLQFIYFIVSIAAFRWGCYQSKRHRGFGSFFSKLGFFTPPTDKQLWVLAVIGWGFRYILLKNQYSEDGAFAGAGTFNMFSVFIYAPLLILYKPLIGQVEAKKNSKIVVILYICFIIFVMVATNSRSAILSPIITCLFLYIFNLIYFKKSQTIFNFKRIAIVIIGFFLFTGPLTDIAYAMLIVRGERQGIAYTELLDRTLQVYSDKELLNKYRMLENLKNSSNEKLSNFVWDEYYVSNVYLQRFCNYRVVDASIYHADRAGFVNNKLLDFFFLRLLRLLPTPIIHVFYPNFTKNDSNYSTMDLLFEVSNGNNEVLHVGYRVGGDVGLGIATFGYWYFILTFIVYSLMFCIFENMILFKNGKPMFSFLVLMNFYFEFFLKLVVAGGIITHVSYVIFYSYYKPIWHLITYKIVRLFIK